MFKFLKNGLDDSVNWGVGKVHAVISSFVIAFNQNLWGVLTLIESVV